MKRFLVCLALWGLSGLSHGGFSVVNPRSWVDMAEEKLRQNPEQFKRYELLSPHGKALLLQKLLRSSKDACYISEIQVLDQVRIKYNVRDL